MKTKYHITSMVMLIVGLIVCGIYFAQLPTEAKLLPKTDNLTAFNFANTCQGKSSDPEENLRILQRFLRNEATPATLVKELLTEKGLSPNVLLKLASENAASSEDNYVPLVYVAARYAKDPEIIKTLLGMGADFHVNNDHALILAAISRNADSPELIVQALIDVGLNVNTTGEDRDIPLCNNINGNTALIEAANNYSDGSGKILQVLVNAGANVNAQNKKGETALMKAVVVNGFNNPKKKAEILIKAGADLNIQDNSGETALHKAAYGTDQELFDMLVEAGADESITNKSGSTASDIYDLFASMREKSLRAVAKQIGTYRESSSASKEFAEACESGSPQSVMKFLEEKKLSPNAMLGNEPLLSVAVGHADSADVVRALLNAGADPNISSDTGETPLFVAVECAGLLPDTRKIKILLEAGADANARTNDGKTALIHYLLAKDGFAIKEEVVASLLEGGTDVNARMNDGTTALIVATGKDQGFSQIPKVIKMLISADADVNAKDKNGLTPLINAAGIKGKELKANEAISMLVKAGADVNARMNDGTTALARAVQRRLADNFIPLLKAGADVNVASKNLSEGKTLLLIATESAYEPEVVIPELLKANTDTNYRDEKGNTAALLALLKHGLSLAAKDPDNADVKTVGIVQTMIRGGADVNAQDYRGKTPIIYAAEPKYIGGEHVFIRTILTLLSAGADPLMKSEDGNTAKINTKELTLELNRNIGLAAMGKSEIPVNSTLIKGAAKLGFDINTKYDTKFSPSDDGNTLLYIIASANDQDDVPENLQVQLMQELIEGGADVNITCTKDKLTAVIPPAVHNRAEVIALLAKNSANLDAKDYHDGETALFYAIRAGAERAITALLDNGANPNTRNKNGITPLIVASAIVSNPEIIRELINAGADPNIQDNEGIRAINYIRANEKLNRTEAVNLLLNAMNSSNRLNSSQTAPRSNSSSAANIDVFKLAKNSTLKELQDAVAKGAKFNVTRSLDDDNEDTELFLVDESPLHIAAAFNQNQGVIKFLVSQGLNVNAYASDNGTGGSPLGNPLSCAVRHKNLYAVRELLEAGADPNSDSYNGYSSSGNPIAIVALEYEDNPLAQTVITALVKADSNVNGYDKHDVPAEFKRAYLLPRSQWSSSDFRENMTDVSNVDLSYFYGSSTPLMYAVLLDKPNIVNTLLDFNANPNIYNAENKLALDYANEAPDYSTIKNSPVFNRLKNATTVASKAIKSDPNFDRADMLVAQGKIPMYVRDKGIFVYNPKMKMVRITGKNVRLRSQPNINANIIDRSDYGEWGSIKYLGEWTHPNGDKWIVGIYDDWEYHPEPTPEWEKKVIWVSAKYARPITMEEYWSWQSTIERAD